MIEKIQRSCPDLNEFFRKFIDQDMMMIDDSVFKSFNETHFVENEKRYNGDKNSKSKSVNIRNRDQVLQIKFIPPTAIWYEFNEGVISKSEGDCNPQITQSLYQIPIIDDWKYLLSEQIKEIIACQETHLPEKSICSLMKPLILQRKQERNLK